MLAICSRGDDRHVGNIGLHQIDHVYAKAELGIVIGSRSLRGKGLGTEAVRLLCGHGFDRLNLHKVWLRVEDANAGARRAFERAGVRVEGVLSEEILHHGERHDSIYMGLLADEWRTAEVVR